MQFVLDTDALRARFKVEPHDMATGRFSTADVDPQDAYGGWNMSAKLRRRESEERVILPPGRPISIDLVKAIILEPVTRDWLRFHHPEEDRPHLSGSGEEREFPFDSDFPRYGMAGGHRLSRDYGLDYRGVSEGIYHRIKAMARRRGIPVIDRRG